MVEQYKVLRAKPEDAPELREIALASKGYWNYPAHLMAQWAQTPIITAESIVKDVVYKLGDESTILGWYRLLVDVSPMVLDDLWVLPQFIGKGLGRTLFEHAVGQARAYNAQSFELDADPNAKLFYEKVGCVVVGETLTEWDRKIPRMRYSLK